MSLIAVDTETTGLDWQHGSRPYMVTAFRLEDQDQRCWEWGVDPLTREVTVRREDLAEIGHYLFQDHPPGRPNRLVFQNPKFDFAALRSVGFWDMWDAGEAWGLVEDTLTAGHLLHSGMPHDLTSMALHYLSVDVQPYEDRVEEVTQRARRYARRDFPDWALAKAGRADMPSARGECWKVDMWLPRLIAQREDFRFPEERDQWSYTCRDYALSDVSVTAFLFERQEHLLRRQGLWEIYQDVMRLLPVIYGMEERGLTVSKSRLESLLVEFRRVSQDCGRLCENIAASLGYELTLPKSGNNQSLTEFVFGERGLNLPPLKRSAKTGSPSLDAGVLEAYESELTISCPQGKARQFVRALANKRKRDTAVGYMEGYSSFWRPLGRDSDTHVLYPRLNPTGTATLRLSSQQPNEQNISQKEGFNTRYCFGPAPGREWWSMDAKNIELRIPAYESGEAEVIALFERPKDPPFYGSTHLLNFSLVYPELWRQAVADVGPERAGPCCKERYEATWYKWCKNGNFAIQYGCQERKADATYRREGAYRTLKSRFAKLERLNQRCIAHAAKHGYVETMPDRSVCPTRGYSLVCSRTEGGFVLPTVPLNYHVQGTACWVIRRGMVKTQALLDRWLREEGFDGYLVMNVHDEIVLDFPLREKHGNLPKILEIKAAVEAVGMDLVPSVPLPMGVKYHLENWRDCEVLA